MLENIPLILFIIYELIDNSVGSIILMETNRTKSNLFLPYKTYYGLPMECHQYQNEFEKCQIKEIKQWSLMVIQYVRLDSVKN